MYDNSKLESRLGRILSYYFLFALLIVAINTCGDMGRVSDQSFHCMTEGGSDYCRPVSPSNTSTTPSPGATGVPGRDGSPGTDGARGPSGSDGSPGTNGVRGTDGYSIVTSTSQLATGDALCPTGGILLRIARDWNRNGLLDSADDQQQLASICNGTAGVDGTDGHDGSNGQDAPPTQFTPIEIIDPCGDLAGSYDEVMLRLQNGTILSSFSDTAAGLNTRFTVVPPGSYRTTDGTLCYFSIDSNGHLFNEHY